MQEPTKLVRTQHQRSASAQLPLPLTPLIGREQEMQTITAWLQRQEVRLLTLTGTAGVGKTRLALQVAAEMTEAFIDGVHFISLASLSDPDLVLPTIAQSLGLRETGGQPLLTLLEPHLHHEQLLLVLDNFEQVIGAAPSLATLLEDCPDLKLLVTSREVLHVRGEQQFEVAPLTVPSRSWKEAHTPEALAENPAIQVLLQRAQLVQPDFRLTANNALSLTEICRLLEGIPLALELAAPRLKLLSPQALLVRLEGRLQVLTGGARDLPERQRTMRAALAWSYELLTSAEQALFRRLAVFVGGWMLSAAEAVCQAAGALELDLLEGLASLLDKSLIRQEQTSEGDIRFRTLYVLREFGLERLTEVGELAATREAHAAYFLALAEEAQPHLRGAQQKAWRDRLEQEYENLRTALTWWLGGAEQINERQAAEKALRLCIGLFLFWGSRGLLHEGRDFMERAMRVRIGVDETVQAKALARAAELLITLGDPEPGEALAQKSLVLARKVGDTNEIARALGYLGEGAAVREEYEQARTYLEEAAALHQQTGNAWMRGVNLGDLAIIARRQGHYERAYTLFEERLVLGQMLGDQRILGWTLTQLGWALWVEQRDLSRAASLAEQGLAHVREVGDLFFSVQALSMLGEIRRQQGKLDEARMLLEEGLAICKEKALQGGIFDFQLCLARLLTQQGQALEAQTLYHENRALLSFSGQKVPIAEYLEGLGAVEVASNRPGNADRLWGAAEVLRESIGAPMYPAYRAEQAQASAVASTKMGAAAFTAAWAEGRSMTPEQTLAAADTAALALPTPAAPTQPPVSPGVPEGLTPREVEVLRLLAQGLSNVQIAERLVVSPLTVHTHLGNIYSKLGVTSRSAATRYALDHHLV